MTTAETLDPHEELGLDFGASLEQVKKAYRRLAAKWHPDRNADPQAVVRMQRINRAYRQLCEWSEGETPPSESQAEPEPPVQEPPSSPKAKAKPKSKRAWWERDWGRPSWQPDGQVEPSTLKHEASISLEAAAFGCLHRVQGFITDLCEDCAGVGRWVSQRSVCRVCDGEGQVPGRRPSNWETCGHCHGDGADRTPCETCEGTGLDSTPRSYHYEVSVPPGVREGQTVILRGQGQRCAEQCADLELTIHVREHALFTWQADKELGCTVPVDLYTALSQGAVEVPSLDGHMIKISLLDGTEQTLAGMGFPRRDGSVGPLHVRVHTVTPDAHNAAQQALLQKLAASLKSSGYANCPDLAAWQQKLKSRL